MALSNKERQARYQRRLKERLAECVTAEDIVEAARLWYGLALEHDPDALSFDDWLKTKGARSLWSQNLPYETDAEAYADLPPEQAELLLRVAKVVSAVLYPPASK